MARIYVTFCHCAYCLCPIHARDGCRKRLLASWTETYSRIHRSSGGMEHGTKARDGAQSGHDRDTCSRNLLIWPNAFIQVFVIAIAGIVGLWLYRKSTDSQAESTFFVPISRKWSVVCLVLYFGLLLILPLLVRIFGGGGTTNGLLLFDSFYRTGSLVFGGGHVVLPYFKVKLFIPDGLRSLIFLPDTGWSKLSPDLSSHSHLTWEY